MSRLRKAITISQTAAQSGIWNLVLCYKHSLTFHSPSLLCPPLTQAPHPELLYIFTETICSELSQPDFPYQHHSELHGDKARAPTERSGISWTLVGTLGKDLLGVGIGGGESCFFSLCVCVWNVCVLKPC